MEYSEQLRELRKKTGKTQEYMAERIGISLAYYQALEQGRKSPSEGMMKLIANGFKVPVSYFNPTAAIKPDPPFVPVPPKPEAITNPPAVKPARYRTRDGFICREEKCGWRVRVDEDTYFCLMPGNGCMKAFEESRKRTGG